MTQMSGVGSEDHYPLPTRVVIASDDSSDTAAAADDAPAPNSAKESKKNKLFGLIKKKAAAAASSMHSTEDPSQSGSTSSAPPASTGSSDPSKLSAMTSPVSSQADTPRDITRDSQPTANPQHHHPYRYQQQQQHATPAGMPSSPPRGLSSSPRLISPAMSQIFERDVQQDGVAPQQPNSPAIPSHIKTENHIPPVLDASSEAITDNRLDPDSVEIITHMSHQPASAALAMTGSQTPSSHPISAAPPAEPNNWTDDLASYSSTTPPAATDRDDSASNYGSIDATDVRRLSFISFADVVLSEQSGGGGGSGGGGIGGGGYGGPAAGSRDSIHMTGLTSLSSHRRSPSPIRSPMSSQGNVAAISPPTSSPGSIKGVELSPSRKPLGSPTSATLNSLAMGGPGGPGGGGSGGELSIETMSQALRRTGSTDMSAIRSIPTSPIEGPSSR